MNEEGHKKEVLSEEDRQRLVHAQADAEDRHRRYVEDCRQKEASKKEGTVAEYFDLSQIKEDIRRHAEACRNTEANAKKEGGGEEESKAEEERQFGASPLVKFYQTYWVYSDVYGGYLKSLQHGSYAAATIEADNYRRRLRSPQRQDTRTTGRTDSQRAGHRPDAETEESEAAKSLREESGEVPQNLLPRRLRSSVEPSSFEAD